MLRRLLRRGRSQLILQRLLLLLPVEGQTKLDRRSWREASLEAGTGNVAALSLSSWEYLIAQSRYALWRRNSRARALSRWTFDPALLLYLGKVTL